ncbi:MAG: hypothetical protein R8P61_06975 [Bacteroidia bacterium]|nr:hypothetical protein [Bacteroidia bacterium]
MKCSFLFSICLLSIVSNLFLIACQPQEKIKHTDTPFVQRYSIKFYAEEGISLQKAYANRNGNIKVLSSEGLMAAAEGQLLYPGKLHLDQSYLHFQDAGLSDILVKEQEFYFLGKDEISSNNQAGSYYFMNSIPDAEQFSIGNADSLLLAEGKRLYFFKGEALLWETELDQEVLELHFKPSDAFFDILTASGIYTFKPASQKLNMLSLKGNFVSMCNQGEKLLIAQSDKFFFVEKGEVSETFTAIPSSPILTASFIHGHYWFGTEGGVFMLKEDGSFDYYYGNRWLADNKVKHISQGPDSSILILSETGLAQLIYKPFTLTQKADYFEKQVRQRHIRFGFNAERVDLKKGNPSSGRLKDSDNDGLWTSMYLASQAFRYSVDQSEEALQNCRESLAALERLYTINPVPGFPSRSFERSGYMNKLSDKKRWLAVGDSIWDWKSTTSSDEAIGHMFAFGVLAELIPDQQIKELSIQLMDTLMSHIVKNDLYLVDHDGKPTTWGRWNPEYVNARPVMVGDRKLNSSNIISMLQTAYHFTQKEKYREKAFELMEEHGYLENLLRPMKEIGPAPEKADDWSKMLSESWNHSDDEMYFLGYWGLYRYAFNDSLKKLYRAAIIEHWEIERPEKEALWNIMTHLLGGENYDLEEAVWYLQEYPLDLINWDIKNSHRKDLAFLPNNFRGQPIEEVLSPYERPIQKHNGNTFNLDRERGNGNREYSAGDIWLLPYWMGRYLGLIG